MRMPKKLHTSVNMKAYLPPNAEEKLRTYVYRGEDRSLLYKHMWRPLCRAIAPRLPYWLAPNVITVTALLVVIANHVSLYWYLPNLAPEPEKYGECPPIFLILSGCGLLVYQLLDNLDGHQARRLGVSSPLGLLMDHGCDAFNCIIGALSICCATGLGPTWRSWWVVLSTLITFFMNTWEEYYRGELVLPHVNGPNEGLLIAVLVYFTSAAKGISFWTNNFLLVPTSLLPSCLQREAVHEGLLSLFRQTHFKRMGYLETRPIDAYVGDFITAVYDPTAPDAIKGPAAWYSPFGGDGGSSIEISFGTLFYLFMCLASAMTVFGNIYQVAVAVRRSEAEHRHGRYTDRTLVSKLPFLHAITRLIPLTVVTVIANMWLAASPTDIFFQHPRLFSWTVGLLFTKLAVHLMIAHLCSVEFHPFRRTLVPFFYVIGHFLFSIYKNHQIPHIDESVTLFEFLMLSAIPFAHLAINVINEMSKTLEVPVFVVPKAKQIAAAKKEKEEIEMEKEENKRKKASNSVDLPEQLREPSITAAATTTAYRRVSARPSARNIRTPTKSEESEISASASLGEHPLNTTATVVLSAATAAQPSPAAVEAHLLQQPYAVSGGSTGTSPSARKPPSGGRTSSAKPPVKRAAKKN